MTAGAVGRLFWKEYRTQRAFWIVVLAAALALQLLILVLADGRVVLPLYGLGMTLTACYAAGCGAVLFAAESEEETRLLLRSFPVSPLKLLAGKLAFALLSTLVMWVLLVGAAALLTGELPGPQDRGTLGLINLSIPELLLWAGCFSLITPNVLPAVFLAVVGMLASQLIASFADEPYNVAIRGVFLVALAGANVWLARRWLACDTVFPTLAWPEALRRRAVPAMLATDAAPPWRRFARRLLWQEARHARTLVLVLLATGVPLCFLGRPGRGFFGLLILLVLFTPLLLGLWSFRNEQVGQRFRFLAHQGIPGEAVWLSKQAIWLGATVLLTLALSGATLAGLAFAGWPTLTPANAEIRAVPVAALPLFVLGSYAIGQFVSLLIARTIVAGFIGAILTAALVTWLALLIWLRVPLAWCVTPLPILLLLATLLRVSDWLVERNTWRGWARVLLCPAAAVVLVLAAFVLYRIYEIPTTVPVAPVVHQAQSRSPLTAGERETIRLYERALALVSEELPEPGDRSRAPAMGTVPEATEAAEEPAIEAPEQPEEQKGWLDGWRYATQSQRAWLDRHQAALEPLLRAAEIDDGAWSDPMRLRFGEWNVEQIERVYRLGNLALLSARRLESEAEFEAALERYAAVLRMARHMTRHGRLSPERSVAVVLLARVYEAIPQWAACSGQTPERIRGAIELLQEEGRRFPEIAGSIAVEYVHLTRAIAENSEVLWIADPGGPRAHVITPILVASRFFWERARALRVVDALSTRAIQLAQHVDTLRQSRGVALSAFINRELAEVDSQSPSVQWLQTTPLLMNPEVAPQWHWALVSSIDTLARRHAAELQLALIAYRHERGRLPASLDELVPEYLDLLPLDPWSGHEFGYEPDGVSSVLDTNQGVVPTNQPLLWSAGMNDSRIVETVNPAGARGHRVVASTGSTYSTVIAFPIPTPGE